MLLADDDTDEDDIMLADDRLLVRIVGCPGRWPLTVASRCRRISERLRRATPTPVR
jgi:hypothetical protein